MNSADDDLTFDAWGVILSNAESIIEDRINEDGMDPQKYEQLMDRVWAILHNPGKYSGAL